MRAFYGSLIAMVMLMAVKAASTVFFYRDYGRVMDAEVIPVVCNSVEGSVLTARFRGSPGQALRYLMGEDAVVTGDGKSALGTAINFSHMKRGTFTFSSGIALHGSTFSRLFVLSFKNLTPQKLSKLLSTGEQPYPDMPSCGGFTGMRVESQGARVFLAPVPAYVVRRMWGEESVDGYHRLFPGVFISADGRCTFQVISLEGGDGACVSFCR